MKKFMMLATILVAGLFIMPNVYAEECTDIEDSVGLEAALKTCETVTLKKNATISTSDMLNISEKDVTLDLNGGSITRTNEGGNTVINVTGKSLVIKDSIGTGKIAYSGTGSSETTAIVVNENGTLTVQGGTLVADTGVGLWGANGKLNFEGGTIQATQNAINSNGANSSNSTIKISGGTITSTKGAIVYMPQSGTLDITNGNLTGYVGIVSRAGKVNLSGGTITTTGQAPTQIGDANVQFPGGVAVIIDNKTPGYSEEASATIGGSTIIKASNENPVLNYENEENEDNSIVVNAGVTFIGNNPKGVYLAKGLIVNGNGTVVDPTTISNVKEETNPNTSDINLYLLLSLIAVSGLGISYTIKRRFN